MSILPIKASWYWKVSCYYYLNQTSYVKDINIGKSFPLTPKSDLRIRRLFLSYLNRLIWARRQEYVNTHSITKLWNFVTPQRWLMAFPAEHNVRHVNKLSTCRTLCYAGNAIRKTYMCPKSSLYKIMMTFLQMDDFDYSYTQTTCQGTRIARLLMEVYH